MPPAASAAIDLQSVRALAHQLYCQCQDPPSAYRPLSKSIRNLRNKLEEADEVLGDDPILPENILVLQAAVESKEVLSRLEKALSSYHRTTAEQDDLIDRNIADFPTNVDWVTHKLSNALEAFQHPSEGNDLTLDTSLRNHSAFLTPGSPSTSTASCDYGTNMSATSTQRSRSPSHTTMLDKMSINRGYNSPVSAAESWRTPFAYFDPMSIDIAQASSMILGSEPSAYRNTLRTSSSGTRSSDTSPLASVRKWAEENDGSCLAAGVERHDSSSPKPQSYRGGDLDANPRPDPELAALEFDQMQEANEPASRIGSDVSWSRGVSDEAITNMQPRQGHLEQSRNSQMLQLSPVGTDGSAPEVDVQRYTRTVHPERHWTRPMPVSPAVTIPPIAQPIQQELHTRNRVVYRASRAVQSRYRVVNLDQSNISRTNSQVDGDFHTPSSTTPIHTPPSHLNFRPVIPPQPALDMDVGKILASNEQDLRLPEPRDSKPDSTPYRIPKPAAQTEVTRSFESVVVAAVAKNDDEEVVPKCLAADQKVHAHDEDHGSRWQRRSRERSDLDSTLTKPPPPPRSVMRSALAPGTGGSHTASDDIGRSEKTSLDTEPTVSIIRFWNDGLWDQAGLHIKILLARYIQRNNLIMARKMRLLLGIIASMKGEWQEALVLFLSVLSTPITETSQLDAGDCAAAHWLGDTYALLGRNIEALLAFSIAERGLIARSSMTPQLQQLIRADQEACQPRGSSSGARVDLDRKMPENKRGDADTILTPKVITQEAASSFLDSVSRPPDQTAGKKYSHDPNQSRANALWSLGFQSPSWQQIHKLKIDKAALMLSGPWALPFDPHFAMANVVHGRLLAHESDLLQLPSSKIPKSAPFSRGRTNCFNCQDLRWLVLTLRECLTKLEIEWSEVSDAQGACFAARYQSIEDRVATTYYFTIALFRLALRPGYGVEICPGGIASARILRVDPNFDKGVHLDENKRIKKLVREYLDAAAKRQEAMETKDVALPVMSINGVTSLHRRGTGTSKSKQPVSVGLSPISSSRGSTST